MLINTASGLSESSHGLGNGLFLAASGIYAFSTGSAGINQIYSVPKQKPMLIRAQPLAKKTASLIGKETDSHHF